MDVEERIEELNNRVRRLEENNHRLEITKLHLLKQIMRLKRERALDEFENYTRLNNMEYMRLRLFKKEYYKISHQIKLLERKLEMEKGIKQSGSSKKVNPAAPRAKTLVRKICFVVS